MSDKVKNILIGFFVVAAISTAICMILFLDPSIGDGLKHYQVRFANISGINVGTRVSFAGKPVGEVISISEIQNARETPDKKGNVYIYQLTLKLDSSVNLYETDTICVCTTGLMGEKSIAILPGPSKNHASLVPVTNQVIYADSTDPFETIFNQVSSTTTSIQNTLNHFDSWFQENQKNLSLSVKSFSETMGQADKVLASIHDQKLVDSVNKATSLLTENLTATKSICNEIVEGKGTVGKFLNSDDFYLRTASILGKADTLMNDINHYGVLFQYDKHWQRSRTKKANFLKALDTPSEFKTYFEAEVDLIQTSLGRLTELMQRASDEEEKEKIVQSDTFKRDFATLLRQVQFLADAIKLYNEELVSKN